MARPPLGTVTLVVLLAAIALSCSGEDPEPQPTPAVSVTASPTPSPVESEQPEDLACADQLATVLDPASRPAGEERAGDVDGDGTEDNVWLAEVADGSAGCRFFVGADLASGTAAVPTERDGVGFSRPPRLNSLVDVDGDGGAEIVVDLEGGASTQFVGLFQYTDGSLVPVEIENDATGSGLMPYGGSVGHLEASDCAPSDGEEEADVVISTAVPKGDRYEVTRTFYVLSDGFLSVEGVPQISTAAVDQVVGGRFPEYRSSPFGSCAS
jgi:hypothetical protein